jgi:hypothetical protein
MNGLLTYRPYQNEGYNPMSSFLKGLRYATSYFRQRIGAENALEVFTCLLEAL